MNRILPDDAGSTTLRQRHANLHVDGAKAFIAGCLGGLIAACLVVADALPAWETEPLKKSVF